MNRPGTAPRVFVALWPDAATRERLVACSRAQSWPPRSRPVAPGNLHLTLTFLGKVPEFAMPALQRALSNVNVVPGQLELDHLECWRKGLVVLCPPGAPDWLEDLQRQLVSTLAPLGFDRDPLPFRPHVTLARRAAGLAPVAPPQSVVWPVSDVALVLSDPPGQYRVLARFGRTAAGHGPAAPDLLDPDA